MINQLTIDYYSNFLNFLVIIVNFLLFTHKSPIPIDTLNNYEQISFNKHQIENPKMATKMAPDLIAEKDGKLE